MPFRPLNRLCTAKTSKWMELICLCLSSPLFWIIIYLNYFITTFFLWNFITCPNLNEKWYLFFLLVGSVPLGNYTPIKATTFTTNFELGVTRAHTSSPAVNIIQPPINYNSITNTIKCHQQQSDLRTKTNEIENGTTINGGGGGGGGNTTTKITATTQKTTITTTTEHHHQLISVTGNGHHSLNGGQTNGGEPESLQYLKPASDDQTVVWSEGASDLLF